MVLNEIIESYDRSNYKVGFQRCRTVATDEALRTLPLTPLINTVNECVKNCHVLNREMDDELAIIAAGRTPDTIVTSYAGEVRESCVKLMDEASKAIKETN